MKKESLLSRKGTQSVLASLISILIGMVAGAIIILVVGLTAADLGLKSAWEGIKLVVAGLFSTGRNAAGQLTFGFNATNMGNMLFRATPLVMTGLSVALGMKAGLFNIGTPGQYLMGTCATLFIAESIPSTAASEAFALIQWGGAPAFAMNPAIIWFLAFLGGILAGALWGAIPGLLKALLNINEVLACIMTNWIAANLVTWVFDVSRLKNAIDGNKLSYVYKTAENGVQTSKMGLDAIFTGSQINGGILIAILLAIVVYIMLSRTTMGYEIKACGMNRYAARYAGIADRKTIVMTMAIGGALAAAGGSLYYLAGNTELFWSTYQSLPAEGFNGIPVALLAANNPIAVVFTAMFMSMLDICGQQLRNLTAYNEYITDVIIAVIVYMSALSLVIRVAIGKLAKRRGAARVETAPKGEAVTGKEQVK